MPTTQHTDPGSVIYATALAEAVDAAGGLDLLREVGAILDALGAAWDADRIFRGYFLSSEVSTARKNAALDALAADRFPALLATFLRLLMRRGRLVLLPEIALAHRAMLDARLGRVPVTLTTAVPVPEDEFRNWTQRIRAAIGGEPVIQHVVKPEIIAGAIIQIGDRVADGSARRNLARLHRQIIERGTQEHALQS